MLSHFQNEFRVWVVVQSEKESYQGMPSGTAEQAAEKLHLPRKGDPRG
jgi:hypothetical protein